MRDWYMLMEYLLTFCERISVQVVIFKIKRKTCFVCNIFFKMHEFRTTQK